MTVIEELPDEIFIQIFSLLSPKMLKHCNLVCKEWDIIISNSLVLMDQFQVNFKPTDREEKIINRRIETVYIEDLSMLDLTHQFDLHSLVIDIGIPELHDLENFSQTAFVETLNSLVSLKHLAFFFLDEVSPANVHSVKLKLERLHTKASVVEMFCCKSLEVLELMWDSNMASDKKVAALRFINRQKHLVELELSDSQIDIIDDNYYDYSDYYDDSDYGDNFFNTPNFEVFKPTFSLEKFAFSCTSLNFEQHGELILFLNSQKETLDSLSLSLHARNIESIEQIQKFIFDQLKNLTDLELFMNVQDDFGHDSQSMIIDQSDYNIAVTSNITDLKFRGLHRTLDENKILFNKLENLKRLYLRAVYEDDFKLLNHISITNLNVVSLKLDRFDAAFQDMPRVYFPKLKSLFVGYFEHNNRNWSHEKERIFALFILKHENTLEKISVGFNTISKITVEAIESCRELKYLEFTSDNAVSQPSFESHMKMLKRVPFVLSRLTLKLAGYTFKFPDDEIFWDELYPKPEVPDLVEVFFKMMLHVIGLVFSYKILRLMYEYRPMRY